MSLTFWEEVFPLANANGRYDTDAQCTQQSSTMVGGSRYPVSIDAFNGSIAEDSQDYRADHSAPVRNILHHNHSLDNRAPAFLNTSVSCYGQDILERSRRYSHGQDEECLLDLCRGK